MHDTATLADLGITKMQCSRYQKFHQIAVPILEGYLHDIVSAHVDELPTMVGGRFGTGAPTFPNTSQTFQTASTGDLCGSALVEWVAERKEDDRRTD